MAKAKLEIIVSAKDQASKVLGGISGTIGGLGKFALGAATLGLGAAVTAVGGLGAGIVALSKDAAKLGPIQEAFEGITESSGESATEMLKSLAKQSGGLISNTDLMKSYNSAAQLVGTSFANQLPGAMQYLSKVSAATGEDMGFMMDSLVKGVGRLSPMILDNLGIQVDLTSANEAYALSIGKTASELTKSEQQTAMMNMVMQKLAENTANMPEMSDPFKQLAITMTNLKDTVAKTVGPVVLPAISNLADAVSRFVSSEKFQGWIQTGVEWLKRLGEQIGVVWEWISVNLMPSFTRIWESIKANLIPALSNLFSAVTGALGEETQGIVGSFGDLIVRVLDWIASDGIPILANFFNWLAEVLPPAIKAVAAFVRDTLIPALKALWAWIRDSLIPALRDMWAWIQENVVPVLKSMWEWIVTKLIPALKSFGAWIRDDVVPALQKIWEWFGKLWSKIQDFKSQLEAIKLPDWLTPGSPTPLELGLRGITDAMGQLNRQGLPTMGAGFGSMQGASAGASIGRGGNTLVLQLQYSPFMSTLDQYEAEYRIKPILDQWAREHGII